MPKPRSLFILIVSALLCSIAAPAQSPSREAPLKNQTVVAMVKGGLPEGVVVGTIQSSATQFDVSPAALAELKKAGLGQKVIDAMVAAEGRKQAAAAAPRAREIGAPGQPPSAAAMPPQPYVLLVQDKAKSALTTTQAQVAMVKSNKKDLGALAADGALAQALQATIQGAMGRAASDLGASAASSLGGATGAIAGGLFKKRTPTAMFVWGVPGRPTKEIAAGQPVSFEVACDSVAGINPEEFAPLLVRLVPARDEWRLVGAAQGKEDARQSMMPDWEMYSSYVEDKIPINANKLAPGRFEVRPATTLAPGEYALVLRPLAKNKKFASASVAAGQGEGQIFNSVWSFLVRQP